MFGIRPGVCELFFPVWADSMPPKNMFSWKCWKWSVFNQSLVMQKHFWVLGPPEINFSHVHTTRGWPLPEIIRRVLDYMVANAGVRIVQGGQNSKFMSYINVNWFIWGDDIAGAALGRDHHLWCLQTGECPVVCPEVVDVYKSWVFEIVRRVLKRCANNFLGVQHCTDLLTTWWVRIVTIFLMSD